MRLLVHPASPHRRRSFPDVRETCLDNFLVFENHPTMRTTRSDRGPLLFHATLQLGKLLPECGVANRRPSPRNTWNFAAFDDPDELRGMDTTSLLDLSRRRAGRTQTTSFDIVILIFPATDDFPLDSIARYRKGQRLRLRDFDSKVLAPRRLPDPLTCPPRPIGGGDRATRRTSPAHPGKSGAGLALDRPSTRRRSRRVVEAPRVETRAV
jgi:hypothetical protein